MHLTALTWEMLKVKDTFYDNIIFAYTRAEEHFQDEERFSVGVKGFSAIPGLSGKIRHRDSVCIIIAGFEGNRAYSAFRHLSPRRAHVILGVPGDEKDYFYKSISEKNNHELLANHRVSSSTSHSLDVIKFAQKLDEVIQEMKSNNPKCNIYIISLGTKLQTIGSVLASQQYPEIQHLFAHPAHRRVSTKGIGSINLINLKELSFNYLKSNRKKQLPDKMCEI
jgi:hypothetical protein